MKIVFAGPGVPNRGTLVVFATEGAQLLPSAKAVDRKLKGAIARAVKANRFKGNKDETLTVLAPAASRYERVVVVGLGKAAEVDALRLENAGGSIHATLAKGAGEAAVAVDAIAKGKLPPGEMAAEIAYGAHLRSYRFDKYRTKEKKEEKPILKALTLHSEEAARARARYATLARIAAGVFFTRDLVSEPGNVIYPASLAEEARKLAKIGVEVEVLGVPEMKRLGMGALLGVAQGSANEPRLVVMQWNGAGGAEGGKGRGTQAGPLAFIGKGVTFDTGGISIKPAAGMEDMKWDMGGAGAVIGLMRALAGRKARVNVVGIAGLVENMPSGTAQRPGDIVKTMSGQTVEVLNTDAEGRLVLADALWYCKERFKPRLMIDLATLTGAIIVSLGHEMAGLFTNDEKLAERLTAAGLAVRERVWRLPLGEEYDKQINSDAADMKNIGNRGAGSITAAQFLQRFVDKTPWAHLDIAGVAWSKTDAPTVPKGGTGYGVRLLDRFIADYYEGK